MVLIVLYLFYANNRVPDMSDIRTIFEISTRKKEKITKKKKKEYGFSCISCTRTLIVRGPVKRAVRSEIVRLSSGRFQIMSRTNRVPETRRI